ncbi:MAG: PssE/Cps14G family polysaccharide biosynthesis glycosyltransferase [archaeon]
MIFVTVGTHGQQFDRLLEKIDGLIGKKMLEEEVFAQSGNSTYAPKNFLSKKFLSESEFEENVKTASLVISHGGAGAIITALKYSKKLILVPRLKEFGEHTDSHQTDLVQFMEANKRALAALDINDLAKKITEAKTFAFSKKSGPTGIIHALNNFFLVKS